MIRILLALALLVGLSPIARAQVYEGILTVPANSGPGLTCCSEVATKPIGSSADPGWSVITKAEFDAFQTAYIAAHPQPICTPTQIYVKSGTVNVCSADGKTITKYPLASLGVGVPTFVPP
jgi:hypothetical protein